MHTAYQLSAENTDLPQIDDSVTMCDRKKISNYPIYKSASSEETTAGVNPL